MTATIRPSLFFDMDIEERRGWPLEAAVFRCAN